MFLHHYQTFVKNGEGNKRGEGGNKRKNLFSLVLKWNFVRKRSISKMKWVTKYKNRLHIKVKTSWTYFFFRDLAEVFLYRIEKQLSKYWKRREHRNTIIIIFSFLVNHYSFSNNDTLIVLAKAIILFWLLLKKLSIGRNFFLCLNWMHPKLFLNFYD